MKLIPSVKMVAVLVAVTLIFVSCDFGAGTGTGNTPVPQPQPQNTVEASQPAKDLVDILIATGKATWYEADGDDVFVIPKSDGRQLVFNSNNTITYDGNTYSLGESLDSSNAEKSYVSGNLDSFVAKYSRSQRVKLYDSTGTYAGTIQIIIKCPEDQDPYFHTLTLGNADESKFEYFSPNSYSGN